VIDAESRRVLDAMPDAVVAADDDGVIVYTNRATEALLGWPAGELIGQPLTTIVPGRLRDIHAAGFGRFAATREPRLMGHAVRIPALRRDGTEVAVELTLSLFPAGEAHLLLGSFRSVDQS
jgi:PAS domain S-box-containing protein